MAKKRSKLKRYLARELDKDIRARYRARISELRTRAREAKAKRKDQLKDARVRCTQRMAKALDKAKRDFTKTYASDLERQKAATVRRNAERAARVTEARERCDIDASSIREEAEAQIALVKKEETEERTHRQQMDRGAVALRKQTRKAATKAKVRKQESDDLVRQNIPRELVPLFNSMSRRIKGSPRMSRSEEFILYVEEHGDEVAAWRAERVPSDMQFAAQEAAFYAEQHGEPAMELDEVPF